MDEDYDKRETDNAKRTTRDGRETDNPHKESGTQKNWQSKNFGEERKGEEKGKGIFG